MIEFIIPQNLPVRAVVATEPNAPPPAWLVDEMERWARRYQQNPPKPETPTPKPDAAAELTQQLNAELEQEIQQLRNRQALFANAHEELIRATKQTRQQMDGLIQEFQSTAVELAHAISAKLIFEEIDHDRFPFENLVHEVVSRLEETAGAVVRLHPDDLACLLETPSIEGSNEEDAVRFVPDSTLSRGDCRAKAGEISVIYELKRQVEDIRRNLLSTVNGHAET